MLTNNAPRSAKVTWKLLCIVALATLSVTAGCTDSTRTDSPTATSGTSAPVTYSTRVAVKVTEPVALVERSTSDDFAFIVSRAGAILRWDYVSTTQEVLDISSLTKPGGERGLLGLAFRDDFAYVNYTNLDGDTVIDEYRVDSEGVFDSTSRRQVLFISQPHANHNGGALVVGPDDMLYIAMGDGGSSNDPDRLAQSLDSLLGKLLRIDPAPSDSAAYSIPDDNPYRDEVGAQPEIWSVGLRNPWRFAFDEDGNLWIPDVGQSKWEEVNFVPRTEAGAGRATNFGWSAFEGSHRFNKDQIAETPTGPIYEYKHGDDGCSVSGGVRVGSDSPLTSLRGEYVFSDYCSGNIMVLTVKNDALVSHRVIVKDLPAIVAVQQTARGVYALSLDGDIYELTAS